MRRGQIKPMSNNNNNTTQKKNNNNKRTKETKYQNHVFKNNHKLSKYLDKNVNLMSKQAYLPCHQSRSRDFR